MLHNPGTNRPIPRVMLGMASGTHVNDHEMHDCLGHEVPDGLVDYAHVRVDQVTDGLDLSLQLRVHRVHEAVTRAVLLAFALLFRVMQRKR